MRPSTFYFYIIWFEIQFFSHYNALPPSLSQKLVVCDHQVWSLFRHTLLSPSPYCPFASSESSSVSAQTNNFNHKYACFLKFNLYLRNFTLSFSEFFFLLALEAVKFDCKAKTFCNVMKLSEKGSYIIRSCKVTKY